uniref:Interleukin-23 subunit alpha n=1 Tax=Geotrypetes seraphini TaxID=260995 RepID=A0A6P8PT07_GEOSA|nr:interleukin-23 subunit alpha-like [Geotrypetes seraphini]
MRDPIPALIALKKHKTTGGGSSRRKAMEAAGLSGRVTFLLIAFCALGSRAGARSTGQLAPGSWKGCRQESRHLNQLAKQFYNQSQDVFPDPEYPDRTDQWFPRVSCNHSCDPCSLRKGREDCLQKIAEVLHWYQSLFRWMTQEIGKEEVFNSTMKRIVRTMDTLQKNLMKHGFTSNASVFQPPSVEAWKWGFILEKAIWNLISFSSIVARVFTPGDPQHHDPGMAQNGLPCSQ